MKTRISALLIAGFLFSLAPGARAEDSSWQVADHGIVGSSYTLFEVTPLAAGATTGDPILLVCSNNYESVFAIDKDGKIIMDFSHASVSALGFENAIEICVSNSPRTERALSSAISVENFAAMSEAQQVDSCRAILELSTDPEFQASGLADYCGVLVLATLADQGVSDPLRMHEGPDPKYCYEVGQLYRGHAWEWSRMAKDVGRRGFNKAMKSLYAHSKREFLKRAQLHLLNAGDSHCLSTRTAASGVVPAGARGGGAIGTMGGIGL